MQSYEYLEKAAQTWGTRTAIITESGDISYIGLDKWSNKIAQALLSQGVGKGDKVAFMFPNCLEFTGIFFAVSKAGVVGVPLNTALAGPELQFVIGHSEAKIVLFHYEYLDRIESIKGKLPPGIKYIQAGEKGEGIDDFGTLVESACDTTPMITLRAKDEAMIFYTSGTTGSPKGVMMNSANLTAAIDIDYDGFRHEDRIYNSTPLFHCSAALILQICVINGTPCYITRGWNSEDTLRLIEDRGITVMWAVPTMLALMQKHKKFLEYDLSSLRLILAGASPLFMDIIKTWKNRSPILKITNGYAQTETYTCGSELADEFILEKAGSIGKPLPGIEMRIVDDRLQELKAGEIGEIAVRSPSNMVGYFKNPELTKKTIRDGWCLSGDLGYADEDGFFYYTGRKKDMIIRGGENIFPQEIEDILNEDSRILESAVIGVTDPVMGEEVLAVLVLKPGIRLGKEEIVSCCERSLAKYKVPRYVRFTDRLPKTSTQKIDKKTLRKEYSDQELH